MRNNCQTPGLSVIAKTRIARRKARNAIRLFAGTLRDRRLIEERESAREVDYADRTHQTLKIEGFGGFAPLTGAPIPAPSALWRTDASGPTDPRDPSTIETAP